MTQTQSKYDTAEKLAEFLQRQTGDVCGKWQGKMSAFTQRSIFGSYRFGKCDLTINGASETLVTYRTLCFGTDFERNEYAWTAL